MYSRENHNNGYKESSTKEESRPQEGRGEEGSKEGPSKEEEVAATTSSVNAGQASRLPFFCVLASR
jgi:hypothetical protein